MTTRRITCSLLLAATSLLVTACPDDGPSPDDGRRPYIDEWRVELTGPAAMVSRLSIGDRLTADNFANRGDVEVIYADGTDQITVEMQRFTIAKNDADATGAFGRMQLWAYDIATPKKTTAADDVNLCFAPDTSNCYIRAYYDGQLQPVRDGANFRVTVPRGWTGNLDIVTEDNLEEGVGIYPDRSDVTVDGAAANVSVDLDSGNVAVRMDPNTDHFANCSANDTCVEMGYAQGCGCDTPTNVTIANAAGQASDITVDVGNAAGWYTMVLENRGTFSASDDFICTATVDCGPFDDCEIDPDFANLEQQERAEINWPGDPATLGNGMRLTLTSEACANIAHVEDPGDYGSEEFPEEKRGDIHVCVGCL
jgi:hypothetical protein